MNIIRELKIAKELGCIFLQTFTIFDKSELEICSYLVVIV